VTQAQDRKLGSTAAPTPRLLCSTWNVMQTAGGASYAPIMGTTVAPPGWLMSGYRSESHL
jgi:hypothetical protein